ncbi:MAG TPA: ferredoxin [Baekduia sp.]
MSKIAHTEIDRGRCAGYEHCVDAAPGAFALDADFKARWLGVQDGDEAAVLEAARACPTLALRVLDTSGRELAPKEDPS